MQTPAYEKHQRHHFKYETIPFIFHKYHLSRITVPFRSLHWHENPEFLRCHSGSGEVIANGKRCFVPGDVIIVNPGEPHGFMAKEDLTYDYMIVDAGFCKENGLDLDLLRFASHVHDEETAALFDRAFHAADTPSEFHTLAARSAILDFLHHLCLRHLTAAPPRFPFSGVEKVKQAVVYINNHYKREIKLQEVADLSGLSVYHFSREFKRVTGQTFVSFLNTFRCERAVFLLAKGASVSAAAAACGFSDLPHFSRTFRKYMGAPPSKFRSS